MSKKSNTHAVSTQFPTSNLRRDSYVELGIRDLLVDRVPAIVWTTDKELQITSCGGSSFVPYRRGPADFIGMRLEEYFGAGNTAISYLAEHDQLLRGIPASFDARYNSRAFTIRISPLLDEQSSIVGTVGVALDVTDQKASEESMMYLATHDALTDLANYRALLSSFDAELHRSDRTSRPFTALLLDVDGLKNINDQYGHLAGSKALCRLANVLKRTCRSIDTVARYGGDEFAILLVETDESAAHRVAQRIRDELAKEEEDPRISASIGIAVYPRDGITVESLLAGADRMLYRNKMRLTLRKAATLAEAGTHDAVDRAAGVERRRSERIVRDISVVVRGESIESQPFQEETFTISISAHGALLMLASKVTVGQTVFLKNPLTNDEKPARVARLGTLYGGIAQIGVEFPEPAPEFWFLNDPSNLFGSSPE